MISHQWVRSSKLACATSETILFYSPPTHHLEQESRIQDSMDAGDVANTGGCGGTGVTSIHITALDGIVNVN